MRAVKSRDTTPEMIVRRAATALGFRYRLHRGDLPCKPDMVFPGRRKVIFVHGCFWHGHDCKRGAREPKTNADYWRAKIERNRERDVRSIDALRAAGWRTLVVWECEVGHPRKLQDQLVSFLGAGQGL